MSDNPVTVTFVDNPHAPEIFASGIAGVFRTGDNIAVTVESARVDHATTPGPVNRVVVGRVVLTVAAAQALVLSLNGFLEQQGLSPSEALKGGQTAQ
jgi:hypothetical protein